jgi:hypothetical protein
MYNWDSLGYDPWRWLSSETPPAAPLSTSDFAPNNDFPRALHIRARYWEERVLYSKVLRKAEQGKATHGNATHGLPCP